MRKLATILALGFLTLNVYSQSKEYKITPEQSKQIVGKYQNAFTIYNASFGQIEVPQFDTLLVEKEEYNALCLKIESLKKDSITKSNEYKTELAKYNEIKSISEKIEEFQKSSAKFKDKKELLKDAQVISEKHNLDYFIYADNTVNQSKTADFFQIRLDKVALGNHLNLVKNSVSRQMTKPMQLSSNSFYELTNARRELLNIEKYSIELKQIGTYTKEALMLGEQISDLTAISGTFKIVGDYYIMKYTDAGYIQNQLVEKSVIVDKNLEKQTLYRPQSLMKDENTGQLLFGTSMFLYNCGTEITLIKFIEKLNELGFKTEQLGEEIFIITSKGKLMLTSDIYKNVEEGNTNYITEISSSVSQFNSLLDKAIPLTDKLLNHFNAYQHATLTLDRLNTWKSEVNSGQIIFESMNKLPGFDMDNLYNFQKHIPTERLKQYNDFSEVLKGSQVILGM